MNLESLRQLLSIVNNNDEPVGVRVHLVKKTEEISETGDVLKGESILEADVSEELSVELKQIFIDVINKRFFDDEEFIVSNISEANETLNAAFYYDLEEFPEKLSILQEFNTWADYPDFSFNNDDIENIKAILITIGNQNNYFTIFKHVYPITILRQDKVIGLIPLGDRFEKLSSSILQINSSVDFIYAQDRLIINSLKTFTNAYGFKEIVINQAISKVGLIRDLDLIENIDELITFVNNIKYAKRIIKIDTNSPVLLLAKDRIIDFIKKHDKLCSRIRINQNGNRIVLDTDVSKIITIGILNDDYLKSHLTDLDYESERKSEFAMEQN